MFFIKVFGVEKFYEGSPYGAYPYNLFFYKQVAPMGQMDII